MLLTASRLSLDECREVESSRLYLFGQAPEGAEPGHPFTLPEPGRADARAKLVDYALCDGTWTALGVHPQFVRDQWPFAEVVHYERGRVTVLSVDDRNPSRVVTERPGTLDDLQLLPSLNLLIPEDTERLLDMAARD